MAESKALCLGLAALLGLVLAVVVYPPSFLLGDAARFHNFVFPNDAILYRITWEALVDRGRPWPSLWTEMFNYPSGFPISLRDGLPLAATVFRPLVGWLPADFHYFGLWHAVVVILQAVAGAALVRAAGVRHVLPCLAAAVFAVAMPIFVGRLNWTHITLATQGLLILALALCIRTIRVRPLLAHVFPRAAALSLVSLAVHPLLALQVLFFGLLAVTMSKGTPLPRASAAVILCLLFAGLCQALGIFTAENFHNRNGLGNSGFSPWGMLAGEPDALREMYGARGPGIEQDAWLGWGCVLLLTVGLAFRPRFRIPRAYYPLAGAIALLAIMAVSPWVRIGTRMIDLSFLLPESVIDLYAIHRATVRLAWPLVASLSLLALPHFVLRWPRRLAVPMVCAALALQCVSAWPYWAYEYRDARVPVARLAPPPPILAGGSRLLFAEGVSMAPKHLIYAMHLATASDMPLQDAGLFARLPSTDPGLVAALPDPRSDAGVRYLAPAPDPSKPSARPAQIPHSFSCVQWEALLVCRDERTQVPPDRNERQPG